MATQDELYQTKLETLKKEVAIVPGTDGQKMSKSYGNTIDIFEEESVLKKQVMGIITDSTPVDKPKDPAKCNVYALYKLLATEKELKDLESKYKKGGFGYGDAKKLLLEKILTHFKEARKKYTELYPKKAEVKKILEDGAQRARKIASKTLNDAKKKVGYL